MKGGGWALLVGSAALAAAVAAMATRESSRSPEEELSSIQERLERGRIDREEALYDLDRLVGRTIESGDPPFVAKLRRSRGRLLMDIAAWDRARDDLGVALGLGVLSPIERQEAEDDLIDLHIRAKDYEKGQDLVKSLLDRDPRDASAWMRSGDLHLAKAEVPLGRARDLIGSRLVAEEALHAEEDLARLAAMDPADSRRPAAGHALAARFDVGDEDLGQRTLRFADEASRENAQARAAFATSLAVRDPRADPGRALAILIQLLDRAGRTEDAAEIGTCGLKLMQSRGDTESVGALVDILASLGRTGYACEVGRTLVRMRNPIAPGRLSRLTGLFYANERWDELALASGRLMQVGNTADSVQASYYSAMSQVHQGQYASGLHALQTLLASPSPEPFEGARAQAWRMLALAARRMRLSDLEREALDTAIQLDRKGSGEEMVRLAAVLVVSARGGYRRPEVQLASAMNVLPERTEELFPLWDKYGKRELSESGLSATDVLTSPAWNRVISGGSNSSPYELHTLARALLFKGQAARAEFYVRQINLLLPDFVPGIDLWIRTLQKLRRNEDLLDALLHRMRLAGADEDSRRVLASLSPRALPVDRRITFMQADPEGFGRREIARGFLDRGRPDLALALVDAKAPPNGLPEAQPTQLPGAQPTQLPGAQPKQLPGAQPNELPEAPPDELLETQPNELPEAREIAAAALLNLGLPQEAFQILHSLGVRSTSTSSALKIYVRAAMLSGHKMELGIATKRAARALLPRRREWLELCDDLLARGAAGAALPFVRRLDSNPRWRGGEVLLRLAWIQLLLGDGKGLAMTLERADAFATAGRVDMVALLACADDPNWTALPGAIERMKGSGWRPNRLQRTALLALEEDFTAARRLIDAALSERPEEPLWVLADSLWRSGEKQPLRIPASYGVHAETETTRLLSGPAKIDSRLLWSFLLAMDEPIAAGWVEARIRARLGAEGIANADGGDESPESPDSIESPESIGLWEHWLLTRISGARGDLSPERVRLEHLLARRPDFEPAWSRLSEIVARSRIPGDGLLDLRERRLHARGLSAGTEAQRCLDIGRIALRDGDPETAQAALARAAELEPNLRGLSFELGRVHALLGRWPEAVQALVAASQAETPASDLESTGALLEALDMAGSVVPPALTFQERANEVEALAKRVPDDPRVPVALAHMDLEHDPRNPGYSVARGISRLLKFHGQHKQVGLERLCAGAAVVWTEFLIELDPDLARSILERERERDPSAIEPWVELGRVRAARREARNVVDPKTDELELVRRMAPIQSVLSAHARVRLAGSPRLKEILTIARDVPAAEGRAEPDSRLALRLARAYFGLGTLGLKPALAILNKLAWTKELPPDLAAEAELLRAEVLVASREPNRAARILGEISERITDPYRATVALTAASLAERMSQD